MKLYSADEFIGDDSVIGVRKYNSAKRCEIHKHEFIELVYISRGNATQIIDGISYEVSRGDIIFINRGATHTFFAEESFSHVEIFFSPQILENGAITPENAISLLSLSSFDDLRQEKNGGKISFPTEQQHEIEFILDAMLREQNKNGKNSRTILESYLNILMARMNNIAASCGNYFSSDVWESLKAYIDTNPEEQMTLSSLAARSFYNPSYFSRVFKKKFDLSPIEYVRKRRIEKAMQMLTSSEHTVEDIITRVGFSDRSAFYHAFSKETGMTPVEYRSKYKCQ
jgi:AraC family L-rhamnose operon transcriptional activator RhaR/AraC family L-rhamnose operon regulatory protein RhaS